MSLRLQSAATLIAPGLFPSDDRQLLLPDLGVMALAAGRGPKYGGWHHPVNLEPGLQRLALALEAQARPPSAEWLKQTLSALSIALAPADPGPQIARKEHPVWTLTLVALHGASLVYAHIGLARAYLWREGELLQITVDHRLSTAGPLRTTESRYLSYSAQPPEVDVGELGAKAGDVLVLLSPECWSQLPAGMLVEVLLRNTDDLDAVVAALGAVDRSRGLNIAVARIIAAT